MTRALVFLSILALAACSSGRAPAPPATTYGPTSQAQPAYRPAQPAYRPAQPATRPMPAPMAAGGFRWHTRLADAQAQARREGKLILVGTTKPGCSLCEQFKNQIVPGAGSQVSSVAVGYMLQALQPEAPQVWGSLKQNLSTATLMPLVGVFSPDLQYLAGFGGPPDQQKLMAALSRARGSWRGAAAPARIVPTPDRRTARLNEFGEVEWTPTGTLWPQPTQEGPAAAPAGPAAPVVAAAPTPAPDARPAPEPLASAAPEPVAPASESTMAAPALRRPSLYTGPDAASLAALDEALSQIRRGEYAAAKQTLAGVRSSEADEAITREAAKGEIAIWNLERIEAATDEGERTRLKDRALANLRGSMWTALFT